MFDQLVTEYIYIVPADGQSCVRRSSASGDVGEVAVVEANKVKLCEKRGESAGKAFKFLPQVRDILTSILIFAFVSGTGASQSVEINSPKDGAQRLAHMLFADITSVPYTKYIL